MGSGRGAPRCGKSAVPQKEVRPFSAGGTNAAKARVYTSAAFGNPSGTRLYPANSAKLVGHPAARNASKRRSRLLLPAER